MGGLDFLTKIRYTGFQIRGKPANLDSEWLLRVLNFYRILRAALICSLVVHSPPLNWIGLTTLTTPTLQGQSGR